VTGSFDATALRQDIGQALAGIPTLRVFRTEYLNARGRVIMSFEMTGSVDELSMDRCGRKSGCTSTFRGASAKNPQGAFGGSAGTL
jgi:hypothetical protein